MRANGLLTVAIVALGLAGPALLWGPIASDSDVYNYLWTRQFAEAYARGELYPRWFPESFEGLGSPTFYFYPPLAFWLSGAIAFLGASPLRAVDLTALVLLLGSGVSMYAWLSYRGTRPILGACLYMAAPYHLYDFYARGALAESAAFVWIPLVALGIQALPKRWASPLLAVSLAGLILSHLPVALLTILFLFIPTAFVAAWRDRAAIAPGIVSGVVGLCLASFYLAPMLALQDHISQHLLWGPHYQPQTWLLWRGEVPFGQIFLPMIGIMLAMCALAGRSYWTIIAVVSTAALVGAVPPLWDMPFLAKVQFPWRLLCVVEFATVTALLQAPARLQFVGSAAVLLTTGILAIAQLPMRLAKPADHALTERFRPDAPEYLPRGLPAEGVDDLQRRASLQAYRDLPRARKLTVTEPRTVTVGLAAFPIWRVVRDGAEVASRGPLVTWDAVPGTYRIERVTLGVERLGAAATLAGAWG